MQPVSASFDFLGSEDAQIARLGALAERFKDGPNTCLSKLRQFGEVLAPRMCLPRRLAEALEKNSNYGHQQ
jgi:type I restriction enzyme R subunit